MFFFLPLYYAVFVRKNPFRYYKVSGISHLHRDDTHAASSQHLMPAALVAFSTGSSAATIPVTLKCVEAAGVSPGELIFQTFVRLLMISKFD